MQDFHEAEIGEIAVERGGRPAAILVEGMHRELDGDAARIADAVARALGELQMHPVARRKVGARLGDADDRAALAQLLRRQAVIHEPLEIERGHVGMVGIVEPVLRAQAAFAVGRRGHG